jgi:cellulose synthase/poly-beta-1,6-N-acetylglucosamine synthase-like glycosyltransferase
MMLTLVFWVSVLGVVYPYLIYPMMLWVLGKVAPARSAPHGSPPLPSVSMIIPVHNEESRVRDKLANTAALAYPVDRLEVIFVSDGSTDGTVEALRASTLQNVVIVERAERQGKAAALNAGLMRATHEILVFSDASILLEPDALQQIVRQFADPTIGCVSGEDRIAGSGGEALYGRYELLLRRLESRVHSIVGASGSFYAQRRAICAPFTENLAPDFLSVLRTVEQGFRAVTEPAAVGSMTSVKDPRQEFQRKVRTLIRGMTTLGAYVRLLNPFRAARFAFALWSHKVMRWLAPVFLVLALVTPLGLLGSPLYAAAFTVQAALYLVALAALWQWGRLDRTLIGRIALYFASVNAAVLVAWWRYAGGVRQELWTPSQR